MRRRTLFWLLLVGWLTRPGLPLYGQAEAGVPVQVRLRDSQGTPVAGEPLRLERLPESAAVPPDCTTDAAGQCTWQVERGLYQLRLTRPLDALTRLALAEGGLTGLGLTVGDRPLTYHFTLAADGYLYFDQAPAAARPQPFVPTWADIHVGEPVPAGTPAGTPAAAAAATVTPASPPAADSPAGAVGEGGHPARPGWSPLWFLALGLGLGGGLHYWRRRMVARRSSARRPEEERHA